MERIKIYVVGNSITYASWINNSEITDNLEEANIVLFTGGEDVTPSLYGKKEHHTTYSNLERDLKEKKIFEKINKNQLALGICRGSQFLCVMNGGILVQNCLNHAIYDTHCITNDELEVQITSTHHQMQYPFNLSEKDYDILYWASPRLSPYYEGDGIKEVPVEPEIVYYHKKDLPKCLAIQGHPEMMRKEAPVINILNEIINLCLADAR